MNVLQWIIIGALVYAIYYVINKYEKRVNELMRLIELNREDIDKNKESIKDLTLIDIDTFLKFQDLFRSKKLKINNCLSEYHSKTKKYGSIFNSVETFNIFIHDKTIKMDYGTPRMLHEEVEKLLDE